MAKKNYRKGGHKIEQKKIFQIKYIVSGDIIEQYRYQKNQYSGFEPRNKKGKNKDSLKSDINRERTLQKAKAFLMRTINCNTDLTKFLTITFEENITDLDYSNNEFKKFIKRLNYEIYKTKKSKVKYVAVIEFQKRGAIHYHVLLNIPYIESKKLQDLWKHGFIKINKIKGDRKRFGSNDCDNVGAYICKYMTKDNKDTRLKNRNTYLMSRNLDKPLELRIDVNEKDLLAQVYKLDDVQPCLSGCYDNEYTGIVLYNQYNLKRLKSEYRAK